MNVKSEEAIWLKEYRENSLHNKTKYLLGNISLLTVATFLPKALIFIMLPLYTSCLGTDEYGTADLIHTTVALLLPVLTLQVQDAVLRFAINKKYSAHDIFTVAMRIIFGGGALLIFGLTGLKALGVLSVDSVILVFIGINYLTGSLNNISAYFLRGIDRVSVITVGSVLDALMTVICNVLLLFVMQWGLYGYLVANSMGAIVRILYYFRKAKLHTYIKWRIENSQASTDMLKTSIPIIFSALAWWVNNASDKYILRYYWSLSVVGIYAVASKIPSILAAFGEVIIKAYSISAIKEFDREDTDGFLGKSYEAICFVMAVICSVLMAGNVFLAKILFDKDFFEGWIYVPPLLISVMMNLLSDSCSNIILAVGKTPLIMYGAVAGAIVNTVCNFLLIPHFGAYGAAIATVIGFFVMWQIRYFGMERYVHIQHNIKRETAVIALLLVQLLLAYWGNRYLLFQVFILSGIVLLYHKEFTALFKRFRKIR